MVDAEKWLKSEYSSAKKRREKQELNINDNCLEGELKLKGFTSLKKLDCCYNQLVKLDVSNCSQLTEIWCSGNESLELELDTLPESLEKIYCAGCSKLEAKLKDCKKDDYYDLCSWRDVQTSSLALPKLITRSSSSASADSFSSRSDSVSSSLYYWRFRLL